MPTILPLDACDLSGEEVRARFDWAVRRGHPHWLWPDISVAAWSAALAQYEAVARQVLTEGSASKPLFGDPDAFALAGYTSGMGPLLGAWLRQGVVRASPGVTAMLDLHLRHNRLRMAEMARRATAVVDALAAAGVEVLVLKGMDTAWSVFSDPATRPLSDIDLLIDPADEADAGVALSTLGFIPGRISGHPPAQNWQTAAAPQLPRTLSFVHRDDPWSVDLQTSLNRRYSAGSAVLEIDRIRSAETLEPWRLSPSASTLAGEARAVHLAVHASCGLESMTLLRLVELVLTVRSDPRFAWDRFRALAEQAGALAMTYPALRFAERLAPETVPAELLAQCERVVPRRVRDVIGRLAPHDAQQVLRCSLEERFMWSPSLWRRLVQILRELHPHGLAVLDLPGIYRTRAWRLLHGTLTR